MGSPAAKGSGSSDRLPPRGDAARGLGRRAMNPSHFRGQYDVFQHRSGTPELRRHRALLSLIDSPFGSGPDRRRSGPLQQPFSSTRLGSYRHSKRGPTSVLVHTPCPWRCWSRSAGFPARREHVRSPGPAIAEVIGPHRKCDTSHRYLPPICALSERFGFFRWRFGDVAGAVLRCPAGLVSYF
jgi:hypothetical protein